MSVYARELITEGYVAQLPTDGDGYWHTGWYVFPNRGPFYGSEAAAHREARGGKVFKVTATYTEVSDESEMDTPGT